jgi:hypothetical protein
MACEIVVTMLVLLSIGLAACCIRSHIEGDLREFIDEENAKDCNNEMLSDSELGP